MPRWRPWAPFVDRAKGRDEDLELRKLVVERLQADLDVQSLRWNCWYTACELLYLCVYALLKACFLISYNNVPIVCSSLMVSVHLMALLLHLCRRRFPRLRLPSPQLTYTLSACLSVVLTMLFDTEIQIILYQDAKIGPLMEKMGRQPICKAYLRGRCTDFPHEGLQNVNASAVKSGFHIIFVLGMRQSFITFAFTNVFVVALHFLAEWPWLPANSGFLRKLYLLPPFLLLGLMLVAKWRIQKFQWHLTVELLRKERLVVEERIKRCQAEHHIELMSGSSAGPSRGRPSSAESFSMVSSGRYFEVNPISEDHQVTGPGDPLEEMASLGRREHWVLNTEDIKVFCNRTLGAGGFGTVLVGTCVGMPVAVKLARNLASEKGLVALANELRILRHVRHPNIALFHGACIEPMKRSLAIVLELVQGVDLGEFIHQMNPDGQGNEAVKTLLLLDICCALYYLHSRHPTIVHGDIKPGNMLVQQLEGRARVKLVDFGLSRVLSIRGTDPLGGTGVWMAPEAYRCPKLPPTCAADVYSFGCVAYFVATGCRPHGDLPMDVYRRAALRCKLPPLRWPDKGIGTRCTGVVDRCLVSQPEMRPEMVHVYEDVLRWPGDSNTPTLKCQCMSLLEVLEEMQAAERPKRHRRWARDRSPPPPPGTGARTAGIFGGKEDVMEQERAQQRDRAAVPPLARATPRGMRQYMLLETISRWHCPAQPGSAECCCTFHEAIRDVASMCEHLLSGGCSERFFAEMQQDFALCPNCLVLDGVDERGDFCCMYCGSEMNGVLSAQHSLHSWPPGKQARVGMWTPPTSSPSSSSEAYGRAADAATAGAPAAAGGCGASEGRRCVGL